MVFTLGLIVNPLAGIGGPAGLAGSDGAEVQAEAIERGAQLGAGERAARFLRHLRRLGPDFQIIAAAGEMGAEIARWEGIGPRLVVGNDVSTPDAAGTDLLADASHVDVIPTVSCTTAEDTTAAARAMLSADPRPDVIVFVGGDGTARDVHDAVGADCPVLGVPAGVKMQSAVFARSPEAGAALLANWGRNPRRDTHGGLRTRPTSLREIADIDEEARRQGRVLSQVWGEMRVPVGADYLQSGKVGQAQVARGSLLGLAAGLEEWLDPAKAWLFGPGSTLRGVAEELGLPASLLGVDLHVPQPNQPRIGGGRESHLNLSAAEIDSRLRAGSFDPQVVVSPIGGQGFVIGRGNQQIDAAVLGRLAPKDLLIVAAPTKLSELGGGPLLADIPDGFPAARLLGPRRVITGRRDSAMIQVLAV